MRGIIKSIQNILLGSISDHASCEVVQEDESIWVKCERNKMDNNTCVERIDCYKIDYPYNGDITISDDNGNHYNLKTWAGKKVLAKIYGLSKAQLNLLNLKEDEEAENFVEETDRIFSGLGVMSTISIMTDTKIPPATVEFIHQFHYHHYHSYNIYSEKEALKKLMKEIENELDW